MTAIRVVASGIDTLHLFARTPLDERCVIELEAARDAARSTGRGAPLPTRELDGHRLTVRPFGARAAPLLLDSDHLALKLNPAAPKGLPTAAVELRAIDLWQRGPAASVQVAERVLRSVLLPPPPAMDHVPVQITRVDLTVDFQGWIPTVADNARFVTRAKHRGAYHQGGQFSGFTFGRGVIGARLYDKTLEIRHSAKAWFQEVWARAPGYAPAEPVWRLEFQIRRAGLRTFRVGPERRRVETWAELEPAAAELWRLLLRGWLSLRLPRTARSRSELAPEWAALAAGGFAEGMWAGHDASLYRVTIQEGTAQTDAQIAGYLRRAFAEVRYLGDSDISFPEAAPIILERARRHAARRGVPLEGGAARRAERWRAEERALLLSLPVADDDAARAAPGDTDDAEGSR